VAERPLLTSMRPILETDTRVVRLRELPCRGEVLVETGDQLEPLDVVARCTPHQQVVTLDLARALGLGIEAVARCTLVEPGQTVDPDTTVAVRHSALHPSIHVTASVRGLVIGLQEGSLFIQSTSDWVQLRAYIPGVVREVRAECGVVMQTTGSVLHGIWGAGREDAGILSLVADSPDAPLSWKQVARRHYGMVLVAGRLESAVALHRAAQYGVAGIVAGSLHPDLRRACRLAPFPIVVTEGMGCIPMAVPAYEMLRRHDGSRVVLAGDSRLTASGPELVIPEPVDLVAGALTVPLEPEVGALVRLTGLAYLGAVAEIVSLPPEPQVCASGESIRGAWVRLADRRLVFVPLANLELLGASSPDPLALLRGG
jgi:hypothetical protein